jgi:hypothetical protein
VENFTNSADNLLFFFGADEDDLTRFHEFQFFSGKFFNSGGIPAQGLDFGVELFVFGFEFLDVRFDGLEFRGLIVDLHRAFVIEYGEQQHGNGKKPEYAEGDPDDETLR